MRVLFRVILATLLVLPSQAQELRKFRQWMDGLEVGGMEVRTTRTGASERIDQREWTQIERMGIIVRQEITQASTRSQGGEMTFTWAVNLSSEPLRGSATWTPTVPGRLNISMPGTAPSSMEIPAGALIWPKDGEDRLKEAARNLQPVHLTEFACATQQWSTLDLQPIGPDPLPGFADTVKFQGEAREGTTEVDLEIWISPQHGEIREAARMSGLTILIQRAELPPPTKPTTTSGFFEQTLTRIPPHPFMPWLTKAVFQWEGQGLQDLPQDPQQIRLQPNVYQVSAPLAPTTEEAASMPVSGPPSLEEAPFLASSPLLQFQDPLFNGLVARMRIPPGATRWNLARRVTSFVFEWVTEKDLAVGFASALEVARTSKGDCTEHGVLAVALLRKLGVPARGVVGWAGLGEVLGLHFWVEVKLGNRWVPVDPTFDQAPASCVRVKVATTDLSSLANIGWDSSSLRLVGGTWVQSGPWAESIRLQGDTVTYPGVVTLRLPGRGWKLSEGRLLSNSAPIHEFLAVTRPSLSVLRESRALRGALTGWWHPTRQLLWIELGQGRWLQVDRMVEASAFAMLDHLELTF